MILTPPTSLNEIVSDGYLVQATFDQVWNRQFHDLTGVEFTSPQVRVHRRGESPVDFEGRQVATIDGGEWRWAQPEIIPDIPGLEDGQKASDDLISAARTLNGNFPILLAPSKDGGTRVIAVNFKFPRPESFRESLVIAAATMPHSIEAERALLGFAAAQGLGVSRSGSVLRLSDGTSVTVKNGHALSFAGDLSLEDVRADAHFYSAEHQMFLVGRFPELRIKLDLPQSQALLNGEIPAGALVIATIRDDTWTWGWADDNLFPNATSNLRKFGIDQALLPLVRPTMPVEDAVRWGLVDVVKPILGWWTHAVVPLNEHTQAVVLLDAPELGLPAPSEAAVTATLRAPLPSRVDRARAKLAYRRNRGIS